MGHRRSVHSVLLSSSSTLHLLQNKDELRVQLMETFMPDDAMFGPESMLHLDHSHRVAHSKESLSFDTDFPTNSLGEDDASSESSVSDLSRFISKSPTQSSMSHVISIRQLPESVISFYLIHLIRISVKAIYACFFLT